MCVCVIVKMGCLFSLPTVGERVQPPGVPDFSIPAEFLHTGQGEGETDNTDVAMCGQWLEAVCVEENAAILQNGPW